MFQYVHVTALTIWLTPCYASHRKSIDIPEYYREEGELVVPSYGYFIRGAQTTFSAVLRWVGSIQTLNLNVWSVLS